MSVHAGEQVQRGAIVKQHVSDQMLRRFRRKAADFRPDPQGPLLPGKFTWEAVGLKPLQMCSATPCLQPSAAQRGLCPSSEPSASSQSNSSVASEQEGILSDMAGLAELEWIQ